MEWSDLTLAARFALASVLGLMVGLEREVRGKSAGLRTFALIAFGAAAFTGIALDLFPDSGDRVMQGVVGRGHATSATGGWSLDDSHPILNPARGVKVPTFPREEMRFLAAEVA